MRFSGPVTALTACRVRYGVGPTSSASPSFARYKDDSSPAAFPSTLSLPFSPWTLYLPARALGRCRAPLLLGLAKALDAGPLLPSFKPRPTDSSHLLTSPPRSTKAVSAPDLLRHYYVTTASSCCRSPLRLVLGPRRDWGPAQIAL
jgi:hypothetical protein